MRGAKALVVVDLQNDFCPGGALEVKEGDKIVALINELVSAFEKDDLPVAFTRDWHPTDHCSFRARGGMWPPHCVQGTPGAEFHPSLRVPSKAIVISKGTSRDHDAYSGFQETDLAERLRRVGVTRIVRGRSGDGLLREEHRTRRARARLQSVHHHRLHEGGQSQARRRRERGPADGDEGGD